MWKINKKGQSTVEYILLVTAVVAVMIVFATNNNTGGLRDTLNQTFSNAAEKITTLSGTLSTSHPLSNTSSAGGSNIYNFQSNMDTPK